MRKSIYPLKVETLGQRIKKNRLDLKLSLEAVASEAGITESYLSRIESDKQIPNAEVAIRIAHKLNDNDHLYIAVSFSINNHKTSHLTKNEKLELFKEKYHAALNESDNLDLKKFNQICKDLEDAINKLSPSPIKNKISNISKELIKLSKIKPNSPTSLMQLAFHSLPNKNKL